MIVSAVFQSGFVTCFSDARSCKEPGVPNVADNKTADLISASVEAAETLWVMAAKYRLNAIGSLPFDTFGLSIFKTAERGGWVGLAFAGVTGSFPFH